MLDFELEIPKLYKYVRLDFYLLYLISVTKKRFHCSLLSNIVYKYYIDGLSYINWILVLATLRVVIYIQIAQYLYEAKANLFFPATCLYS